MIVTDWPTGATVNWLFRDDGLSNSQAHIALNDHTSLFHETKEPMDGNDSYGFLFFFTYKD